MMKLPTFLGIGVEKAGTTSIYTYLKQHPQVYMSPVKETNFLERDWDQVDDATRNCKKERIDTFEKYSQLFDNVTDEIALGEISPNYLFHYKLSVERIRRYVPDARLIAILRDPADRAYSDYLMHIRDAIGQDVMSLSDQIQYKAQTSFTIQKGFYYERLKYFFDTFGSDQIKVYLYDDLCKDAIALMQDLYRFIGVDDTFVPDTSIREQVGQVPKVKVLNSLMKQKNPVRAAVGSMLQQVLPPSTRQRLRSTIISLNSQDKSKAPFLPDDRRKLIELYREDILQLQDLLQRDLSTWMVP